MHLLQLENQRVIITVEKHQGLALKQKHRVDSHISHLPFLVDGLVTDPSVFRVDRSYPPKQYTMNIEPTTERGNRESYYYNGKTPKISSEA